MSLLSKAEIFGASDLPTRDVEVPEWGGIVRIIAMTAAQREGLETEYLHAKQDGMITPANWRARHLALSVIGDDGKLLFTEADAIRLGEKSAKALARVFDVINEHNRVGADIEAAAKN